MTASAALAPAAPRHLGRSILAVAAAIVANALAALALDQLFHVLGVYPPWGEPMYEPALNLLALSYRTVIGVGSGWLVARLAPGAPLRHAAVLGAIGTALAALGVLATIGRDLGPTWYPIALVVLAYPTVWLGARLALRRAAASAPG